MQKDTDGQKNQRTATCLKSKTEKTRMGDSILTIAQVREGSFYTSALEKEVHSEYALIYPLAKMNIQGVSTNTNENNHCSIR